MHKLKFVFAVTVSESLIFFRGYPSLFRNTPISPLFVSSGPLTTSHSDFTEGVNHKSIPMQRNPSIAMDLIALLRIFTFLLRERPYGLNVGTPKASLLFLLASFLLRTPVRIYHCRGFRHQSLSPLPRLLYIQVERLCSFLATNIICETDSVLDYAKKHRIFSLSKTVVLANGSSGIDYDRLTSTPPLETEKLLASLRIGHKGLTLGYVGRLVERKGIYDLFNAWKTVEKRYPTARLVIIGDTDSTQPLNHSALLHIHSSPSIVHIPFQSNIGPFFELFDVFTLPSHWEGFGNVLAEAAHMSIPCITTFAVGCRDAVDHLNSGLLVPAHDPKQLAKSIIFYFDNPHLRRLHGKNGSVWSKRFSANVVQRELLYFLENLLPPVKSI